MKLISLGSLNLSLVVEDSVWFLLRAILDYSALHAGNVYRNTYLIEKKKKKLIYVLA